MENGQDTTTSTQTNDLTDQQMENIVNQTTYEGAQINRDSSTQGAPPATTQDPTPYEKIIKVKGQEIKVDSEDKLIKWAQQGYDYNLNQQQLKQQQQEFDDKYKLYENIDKYAQENPDWWNRVNQSYSDRTGQGLQSTQSGTDQSNIEDNPALQQFKSELDDLRKFKDDILAERESSRREKEDAALEQEIKSIRELHGDLDWSAINDEGKTLERQILEHAGNNGINSFRAAFRDFYHDKLLESTKLKAKEEFMGEYQNQRKAGLLGETPAPLQKVLTQPQSIKNQTYDSLMDEALKEYGITGDE